MNEVARNFILELETFLKSGPTVELDTAHHFAHGTYTRVLYIPAGVVLTGKIHRHSCINILAQGEIEVATENGHKTLKAPEIFVSGPGIKKAGYALTDCVFINVHPWEGDEDLEAVEREVIVESFEALEAENRERIA